MKRNISVSLLAGFALVFSGCEPEPEIKTYPTPKETSVPTTPTAPTAPTAPTSAPGMSVMPGMVEQSQGFGEPTWTAPEGWVAQAPGSIRKGSWKVPGAGGEEADLSVTVFPGDVGGDLANVNRWRSQVGLGDIPASELGAMLEHTDVGDAHAHVVMIEGPGGQSILGAIVPRGGGTWFFKMQGPSAVVKSQREAFDSFLKSVQFPAPNAP